MSTTREDIVLGRITSAFGVHGWVKVFSYTDPIDNVLGYPTWTLRMKDGSSRDMSLVEGRRQGHGLVACLEGVNDRDQALAFLDAEIRVPVSTLPALESGEFYWHQLEGLQVETVEGEPLGYVDYLIETGSNDVLVVKGSSTSRDQRERLIPYLPDQVVKNVDLAAKRLIVDWDTEF